MKKRNLLSLSALVLSLGLAVTSCAGPAGQDDQDGQDGPEGPQGEQGPQGEAGEDGKTYVPIIVVNDKDIEGVKLLKTNIGLKQVQLMKQLHLNSFPKIHQTI